MQAQGTNPSSMQHPERPGSNPLFRVANAIFICAIDIPTIFQGDLQFEQISGKIFDDDFMSCMDKTVK